MAIKKEVRKRINILDLLYVVCALAVIGMAVFVFIDLNANRRIVSLIFAGAAVLMLLTAIMNIIYAPRGKKSWGGTIVMFILGMALMALAAISFVVLL